jgi:hypothetical protein
MKASCAAVGIILFATATEAQWLNHPASGIPRTRDGKPKLAARTPKARPKGRTRRRAPRSYYLPRPIR